jgi:hypothetical protein
MLVNNFKGANHLEERGIDGRVKLKLSLYKYERRVWARVINL